MAVALYRRANGSTNFRKVNPWHLTADDWDRDKAAGGNDIVALRGAPSSLREELSGLEVNELAGRVVVQNPEPR